MPPVLSRLTKELQNQNKQRTPNALLRNLPALARGVTQGQRMPEEVQQLIQSQQQQQTPQSTFEQDITSRRQRLRERTDPRDVEPRIPTAASTNLQHDIETRDFTIPYMRQIARLGDIREENERVQQAKNVYQNQLQALQNKAMGQVQLGNIRAGGRRSKLIQAAQRFLGTPYSWGGGGPGGPSRGIGRGAKTVGFDCSGLVQYAYSQVGMKVPRVSYGQLKMGSRRAIQNLLPGDLVGFGNGSHVAIYLGGGRIIESPRTGLSVRVRKLTGSDYKRAWGVHINV